MEEYNQQADIYSVSQLTNEIRSLLEEQLNFVWLEGEISNFRSPVSGHYYMTLKDQKSQIRAVMFRLQARYLRFVPENGMKVLAQGRVSVYTPRGEYQIKLDYLEPLGSGDLALAFEQLKQKLALKGVFDQDKKRTLPFLPQKVAVITSPTGAAIRDFLEVLYQRFANIEVIVVPVRVQGNDASNEMIEAIELVNRDLEVDVILLTRGGGSLEDLWPFNDEKLALVIRGSHIPIVSAVGHEIDITISDMASDVRAPTPSAAAELLVSEKEILIKNLFQLEKRLTASIRTQLNNQVITVAHLSRRLKDPRKDLEDTLLRLDDLHGRLVRAMGNHMSGTRIRLETGEQRLRVSSPPRTILLSSQQIELMRKKIIMVISRLVKDKFHSLILLKKRTIDLSPLSILSRGYSIARKLPEKKVIRKAGEIDQGDRFQILLSKGMLEGRVEKSDPEGSFDK